MCTKVLHLFLLCIRGAICLISLEFNLADCDRSAPASHAFTQITGENIVGVLCSRAR